MTDTTERVSLITGGSRGLGEAIAEALITDGHSVMLCARDFNALEEVKVRLSPKCVPGRRVSVQVCDVTEPAQVTNLVDVTLETYGHLDVLINNAGVYGPMGLLEDIDWEDWVRAIHINVMGTVLPCRSVLPHFKARGQGRIINISGGGATNPLPRISAYAASKAAVVRFTETLALEVASQGITVNAVAPGALNTQLMDQLLAAGPDTVGKTFYEKMRQIHSSGGTPLEVGASLCSYLASDRGGSVNGRLISAVWDPWREFEAHAEDIAGSDVYTLRRIVPSERGMDWGNG